MIKIISVIDLLLINLTIAGNRNEIAKIDVIEIRWWKPNNVNSDVISLIDSKLLNYSR